MIGSLSDIFGLCAAAYRAGEGLNTGFLAGGFLGYFAFIILVIGGLCDLFGFGLAA